MKGAVDNTPSHICGWECYLHWGTRGLTGGF